MPVGKDNGDQVRIADDGSLELSRGPETWDGEPLFCSETVQESLFARAAFEQMRGQLALGADDAGI